MPAYILASIDVTDPAAYEAYRREVPALLAAHGGRFLVRGGAVTLLEGAAAPGRQVVLEFPNMEALRAFYDAPDYQRLLKVRQAASTGTLIAVEGV